MGQQTNKIIKRRRRAAYLERKKNKAKEVALAKPKARRTPPPARKATAPAPEAAPEAAVAAE